MDFKEKRQYREATYQRLALIHRRKADQRYEASRAIGDRIPMGQPILVGHHSERGHRADLKRIENHMTAMTEHVKKAEYFERRVKSIQESKAIFIDDPEAIEKLSERIEALERLRDAYKAFNKVWKAKGLVSALEAWPGSQARLKETLDRYNVSFNHTTQRQEYKDQGRLPTYLILNLTNSIARYKKQLVSAEIVNLAPNETKFENETLTINVEQGRLNLYFSSKPERPIIDVIKRTPFAFRWSPSDGCWTRKLNPAMLSPGFINSLTQKLFG